MHSQHMMRPLPDDDIVAGPFIEATTLKAGLEEMARLAVQAGMVMCGFIFSEYKSNETVTKFLHTKREWMEIFYRKKGTQDTNP